MITKLILASAGIAAAMALAPSASADPSELTNADIAAAQDYSVVSLIPIFPTAGGPHPYATGYNISPRYEFTTDPVTGKRHAKFDDGCNGAC